MDGRISGILTFLIGLLGLALCQESVYPNGAGLIAGVRDDFGSVHLRAYEQTPTGTKNLTGRSRALMITNVEVDFLACTTDYTNKSLYLYDFLTSAIYRFDNFSIRLDNSLSNANIQQGVTGIYVRMAVDWVTHNIYFTDSAHKWIIMKSGLSNDTSMYKVIERNLEIPGAIAVDSIARYIFWSELSINEKIERASLSGGDRKVIVNQGIYLHISMGVDPNTQTLCWIDYYRTTMECSDYNGKGRYLVQKQTFGDFYDMAMDGNIAAVTDIGRDQIMYFNTSAKKEVYFPESRFDYCKTASCPHLCVNEATSAKCICKEGYKLNTTTGRCDVDRGLFQMGVMLSNTTHLCIMDIRSLSKAHQGYSPFCFYSLPNQSIISDTIQHFVVDANTLTVYFATKLAVYSLPLDVNGTNLNATKLFDSVALTGLELDWIDQILFFTDLSGNLGAYDIQAKTFETFDVSGGIRDFIVVPLERTLAWISREATPRIVTADMKGQNRRTIAGNTTAKQPRALAYNQEFETLFWVDYSENSPSGQHHVMETNLNGSEPVQVKNITNSTNLMITYKGFLVRTANLGGQSYYITSELIDIETNQAIGNFSYMGLWTAIRVLDQSDQPITKSACRDMNGGCEHLCIPDQMDASRATCLCEFGYQLNETDKKSCVTKPVASNFMLMTDGTHRQIYQVSMPLSDSSNVAAVPLAPQDDPIGVVYDHNRQYVIYTSYDRSEIRRVRLNGSGSHVLCVTPATHNPYRLAIDLGSGYVYFLALWQGDSSDKKSYIAVCSPDGLNKTLVNSLSSPRDIAVDPSEGYMFWTDLNALSTITRADMSGENKLEIVKADDQATGGIVWPNGLAIDHGAKRVYWTDIYYETIHSVTYSGGDKKLYFQKNMLVYVQDIVIDGNNIFFTAHDLPGITKKNLNDNSTESNYNPVAAGRLYSLFTYNIIGQKGSDSCRNRNGNCSTFCLPTPSSSRKCACIDGVRLQDDQRTCTGVPKCPTTTDSYTVDSNCLGYENERCTFTCNDRYELSVSPGTVLTCTVSGQTAAWDTQNLCRGKSCPALAVSNGVLDPQCSKVYPKLCNFTCNNGYQKKEGVSTITCFNDTSTVCEQMVCKSPSIPHGQLDNTVQCDHFVGSSCNFICDADYEKAFSKITCQTNMMNGEAEWKNITTACTEVKRCQHPTILYGELASPQQCDRRVGTTCNYTCKDIYRVTYPGGITCQLNTNGVAAWKQNLSIACTTVFCPQKFQNGQITNACSSGSTCTFSCDSSYQKNPAVNSITCKADATLDIDSTTQPCIKKTCGDPLIPNGQVNASCTKEVSTTCMFTCNIGYTNKIGGITCQANQDGSTGWKENLNLVCIAKHCGQTFSGGSVDSTCVHGTNCTYTCDQNYMKDPTITTIRCTDGQLNIEPHKPPCKDTRCPPLKITNGALTAPCSRQVNQVCEYKCNVNYTALSETKLTCLTNRQWNLVPENICVAIQCPATIPYGSFYTNCTRKVNAKCTYKCSYDHAPQTEIKPITCGLDGKWVNADKLCLPPPVVEPQKSQQKDNTGAVAGGVVGGLLALLLIIAIIVVAFFFIRRKGAKPFGRHVPDTANLPKNEGPPGESQPPGLAFTNPTAAYIADTNIDQVVLSLADSGEVGVGDQVYDNAMKKEAEINAELNADGGLSNPLYDNMVNKESEFPIRDANSYEADGTPKLGEYKKFS